MYYKHSLIIDLQGYIQDITITESLTEFVKVQ